MQDGGWDAAKVGDALVRAYRLLDGAPILSRIDGFSVDGVRVGPASLAAWIGMRRYVVDEQDLRYLRVWAAAVARGERVKPRFEALGWHPVTADRHRRASLAVIADGLNAERAMAEAAQDA